jgi:hypothetical protein
MKLMRNPIAKDVRLYVPHVIPDKREQLLTEAVRRESEFVTYDNSSRCDEGEFQGGHNHD